MAEDPTAAGRSEPRDDVEEGVVGDVDDAEVKVLAIASHVVYGYVGNTMATFVMQALGLDVAGMNTVHFSNHTGYRRFTGTRTPAEDLTSLYDGLKAAYLTDFSIMLSGYIPSAAGVSAVGAIARDLRLKAQTKPGGFFWVLDPVMGDNGRLYVEAGIVDAYKSLIREADLILPNQFEVELLSGLEKGYISEHGETGALEAIARLHKLGVRHVIITSLRTQGQEGLVVVGSSMTNTNSSTNTTTTTTTSTNTTSNHRAWKIHVPELPCFFSGTGDMFAGLMVGHLHQEARTQGVLDRAGWIGDDDTIPPQETPLAKAAERVLSSMQIILEKTMKARDREMRRYERSGGGSGGDVGGSAGGGASLGAVEGDQSSSGDVRRYLAQTKAAEVRVVKNWRDLVEPDDRCRAVGFDGGNNS